MEISKEQKEAIEMLDKFITEHKLYNIKQSDGLEDNIKIVLYLIEKLQKENEELEEINNELEAIKDEAIRRYNLESIPVSLVKEKIEKINKAYEDSKDENGESQYYYPDYTIRVLEELLEKRK